jgi:cobalt-zinc-cadmium efflux system protein
MKPHHTPHLERRLILSLGFTGFIFLAELLGGFWTGSLALLSDAAHVFMDMFAIGLSYLALRLSALPADDRHTYGWHRLEVLAALLNGITLLVISVGIWYEAYQRWLEPPQVRSLEMFIIAVVGLVVNLIVALIGVIILVSALRVTRAALHILVEGTPEGISPQALAKGMLSVDSVDDVHDLHVWSICSGHVALSAHVVLDEEGYQQQGEVMSQLKEHLRSGYGIEHTTIQFEEVPCEQGNGCGSS